MTAGKKDKKDDKKIKKTAGKGNDDAGAASASKTVPDEAGTCGSKIAPDAASVSNGNSLYMVINAVLVVVLIAFLCFVYCRANAKDISLDVIEGKILSVKGMDEMDKCDERDLMQFIGIDYSDINSFVYYQSSEAMGVDELLIIKLEHKSDAPQIDEAIENRISAQIKAFESYGPEQVKRLKNAVVSNKGRYVFYCTAKNPDSYEEVFKNAV